MNWDNQPRIDIYTGNALQSCHINIPMTTAAAAIPNQIQLFVLSKC